MRRSKPEAAGPERAASKRLALDLLARREHSRFELDRKLTGARLSGRRDRRHVGRAGRHRCARGGAIHRQLRPHARSEGAGTDSDPRGAQRAGDRRAGGGQGRCAERTSIGSRPPALPAASASEPPRRGISRSAPAKPDSCNTAASKAAKSRRHWNFKRIPISLLSPVTDDPRARRHSSSR